MRRKLTDIGAWAGLHLWIVIVTLLFFVVTALLAMGYDWLMGAKR